MVLIVYDIFIPILCTINLDQRLYLHMSYFLYKNTSFITKFRGAFWCLFQIQEKPIFSDKIPIFSIPVHDTGSKVRNSDPSHT